MDDAFKKRTEIIERELRQQRAMAPYDPDENVSNDNDFFNFRSALKKKGEDEQAEKKKKEDYLEANKYKMGVKITTPNLQKNNQVEFHPSMLQEPFELKSEKRSQENSIKERFKVKDESKNSDKIIEIEYKRNRTPVQDGQFKEFNLSHKSDNKSKFHPDNFESKEIKAERTKAPSYMDGKIRFKVNLNEVENQNWKRQSKITRNNNADNNNDHTELDNFLAQDEEDERV